MGKASLHEFHGEIGDARELIFGKGLLKPCRRFCCAPSRFEEVIYEGTDPGIGKDLSYPVPRHGLQNHPWIVRELPKGRIDLLPQGVNRVVPGPAHVEGKLHESIHALHIHRQKAMQELISCPSLAHGCPAPSLSGASKIVPLFRSSWPSISRSNHSFRVHEEDLVSGYIVLFVLEEQFMVFRLAQVFL